MKMIPKKERDVALTDAEKEILRNAWTILREIPRQATADELQEYAYIMKESYDGTSPLINIIFDESIVDLDEAFAEVAEFLYLISQCAEYQEE